MLVMFDFFAQTDTASISQNGSIRIDGMVSFLAGTGSLLLSD
jgi:hypothetical protein